MTDITTQHNSYSAYIKDGILYNEFIGELTLEKVLLLQKQSVELLQKNNTPPVPIIVILKDISQSSFKLKIADYARAFGTFDLIKRVSSIWIVGGTPEVKKSVNVINKIFFSDRMQLVNSVKEAQDNIAREKVPDPILEKTE